MISDTHAGVPRRVTVTVEPLPDWLAAEQLLGAAPVEREALATGGYRVRVELAPPEAAFLLARLRGLGIDGSPVLVRTRPELGRSLIRAGRLQEARARRDTTPAFSRPQARATGEGRYSLTPEPLALALGRLAQGRSVVEACAGSGGNSIGFARAGCAVTAIEISQERLSEAQHNARVYGVNEQIQFRLGDALACVPQLRADLLFVDPPWGEHYDKQRTTRESLPLLDALLACDLSGYREIWVKVPASFATETVPEARPEAWFGVASGDANRIKFVLLRLAPKASLSASHD